MRQIPFRVQAPRQTGTGTGGGWIQEGGASPVVSFAFDSVLFEPTKLGALVVMTDEFVRVGNEQPIRDALLNAIAGFTADAFLNPAHNDNLPVSPASITNSGTAVTSTGGSSPSASQLTTDLGSMIAAITTTGGGLTWIMKPTTAARIALVLGGAASDIPRTLFGIPMIISKNAGARIVLADLNEVGYAAGGLEIALSSQAAVQMDDAPTNQSTNVGSPEGTSPTSVVSLFQANATAFRVTRFLNWEVVRSGAVTHMTVAY
jgi:HK97 family phage major capsid protein